MFIYSAFDAQIVEVWNDEKQDFQKMVKVYQGLAGARPVATHPPSITEGELKRMYPAIRIPNSVLQLISGV